MRYVLDGLAVAGGGALGALLRWVVALGCGRLFGQRFPVGTMVINLTGSFFLGWFVAVVGTRATISDTARLGIAVGFVGAYTTFSTFMLESSALWGDGAFFRASANVLVSIALGLLAVKLGMYVAK